MIETLRWLAILIIANLRERADLALENLALRQQLGVLRRNKVVPRLRRKDRVFWAVLSRIWPQWRKTLHLVKADTGVGWQRKGFRIYWARISRQRDAGRPEVSVEVRVLIKRMATANGPYRKFCAAYCGCHTPNESRIVLRRDCLDWFIPLGERHLRTLVREWAAHYNQGPAAHEPGSWHSRPSSSGTSCASANAQAQDPQQFND